jgi:hypothetical protein
MYNNNCFPLICNFEFDTQPLSSFEVLNFATYITKEAKLKKKTIKILIKLINLFCTFKACSFEISDNLTKSLSYTFFILIKIIHIYII